MLQSVRELMLPAAQERLVLVINHVVSREPAATQRLKPHAGSRLAVEVVDLPPWLPALPPLRVAITPAGLFERDDTVDPQPELILRLPLPRPDQLLAAATSGALPPLHVEGAAGLAADVHWLADNLRWDVEGDLAQWFGPVPARLMAGFGQAAAQALRALVRTPQPEPAPPGGGRA